MDERSRRREALALKRQPAIAEMDARQKQPLNWLQKRYKQEAEERHEQRAEAERKEAARRAFVALVPTTSSSPWSFLPRELVANIADKNRMCYEKFFKVLLICLFFLYKQNLISNVCVCVCVDGECCLPDASRPRASLSR